MKRMTSLITLLCASQLLSGQNVGIGTNTPGFPLNFSNALGDKISLYGNTGVHYGFGIQNNLLQVHTDQFISDIGFGYGSSTSFTELMRIKGTGNVGIGTIAPTAKLHLKNASSGGNPQLRLDENSVGFARLNFTNTTNPNAWTLGGAPNANNALAQFVLYYEGSGLNVLNCMGNGNVGIATSSPAWPLTLAPTLGDKICLYGLTSNHYGFGIQNNLLQIHTDQPASDIAFGYGSSAAFTEVMRIKGNGNVGIGTQLPSQKLEVNGAIKISDVSSAPSNGTIRYNPATKDFEGYDGTQWRSFTASPNSMPPISYTPPNQQAGDNAGFTVKMINEWLFVSIPNDDIGANADQGSVNIYRKNQYSGAYELHQVLLAADGSAGDLFGYAMDVYESSSTNVLSKLVYIAVSAPAKNIGANIDQGAVYIYVYNPESGNFESILPGYITSSNGSSDDNFGFSISFTTTSSQTALLIGAPYKMVNGNFAQGSAYLFGMSDVTTLTPWYDNVSESYIFNLPSNQAFAFFGYSLWAGKPFTGSLSDNGYYAIGAPAHAVNGNTNQGKVFMYNPSFGVIFLDTTVTSTDGNSDDYFGIAIQFDFANHLFLISASQKEFGTNIRQGAFYAFHDSTWGSGTNPNRKWVQKSRVNAPDGVATDEFGTNMYFTHEGLLLVGCQYRDDINTNAGAVYVYEKTLGNANFNYSFKKKITDPAGNSYDFIGKSIHAIGNNYVIGVPDADNNAGSNAGKFITGSIFY